MTVVAGVIHLDKEKYSKENEYTIDYVKAHENYRFGYIYDDIGLIHVTKPIAQGQRIPIKSFNEADVQAVLTGWGKKQANIIICISFLFLN